VSDALERAHDVTLGLANCNQLQKETREERDKGGARVIS
jgi:hypothetical protein